MNYIIKDYSNWKKLNEQRYKAGTAFGNRVVLIAIDDTSFKIKAIKEIDIVDANDKMIPSGWVALRDNFLKTNIPSSNPAVKKALDTKTNFIIYDVNKANDRKQVITFTVKPRTEAPGLPPNVEYISQAEITAMVKDPTQASVLSKASQGAEIKQGTVVPTGAPPTAQTQQKLAKPIAFAALKGADGKAVYDDQGEITGPIVVKALDSALISLSKMPEVAKNPILSNLKSEIKAGQLGDSAITFIKAVIAGFGLKDKYGDSLEIVNQSVVDKLATFASAPKPATAQNASRQYYLGLDGRAIYEEESVLQPTAASSPAPAVSSGDFNMEAFLKALGGTQQAASTGDIKLPEGGIKYGVKGDAELKKVQQLIIDKLGKVMADDAVFKKFKGYGADGSYGPTTKTIVAAAKAGFKLSGDGSTITPELVTKLQTEKISESYLGLNGLLNEAFDVEAAKKITSGGVSVAPKKEEVKEKSSSPSSANEVIDLLKSASTAISNLYQDESFFSEYKGVNDDEAGAVKEIFGSGSDDASSWWYSNIVEKYLTPAKKKLDALQKENSSLAAKLMKEYDKISVSVYTQLKEKTAGDTGDDEYVWSILDMEGKKTTYKVDTDF